MAAKKPRLYKSPQERTRVRKSESAARRNRAGVADVKRLRDNMRRLERRAGVKSEERALSDRQIKKLTKEERQAVAKRYAKRLREAEGLINLGIKPPKPKPIPIPLPPKPPTPPKPEPPRPEPPPPEPEDGEDEEEDFSKWWSDWNAGHMSPEQSQNLELAWDNFRSWMNAHGRSLEPGSELSRKLREQSEVLAMSGASMDEIFNALCGWYMAGGDIEDVI